MIRSFPAAQPKRHAQRILLGTRQAPEPIEHRDAQLLKRGERQLHLRLDADCPQDAKVRARADRVIQQRRLAYARLAAEHEGAALTTTHRLDQSVERRAFCVAPSQGVLYGHRPDAKATPGAPPCESPGSGVDGTRLAIQAGVLADSRPAPAAGPC